MLSPDGKMCKTYVATTKQLLRPIQSVPSPKAEPLINGWPERVKKELKK